MGSFWSCLTSHSLLSTPVIILCCLILLGGCGEGSYLEKFLEEMEKAWDEERRKGRILHSRAPCGLGEVWGFSCNDWQCRFSWFCIGELWELRDERNSSEKPHQGKQTPRLRCPLAFWVIPPLLMGEETVRSGGKMEAVPHWLWAKHRR